MNNSLVIILISSLIILAIPIKLNHIIYHYNTKEEQTVKEETVVETLGYRIITAYSSSLDETDSTPFITASNQRVRRGIIATNELPMGTKVMIIGLENSCMPDIVIFEVQDRTNRRYSYRLDIWCESKEEAFKVGRQTKEIVIVQEQ